MIVYYVSSITFYSSLHWCGLLFYSLEHRKSNLRVEVMEGAGVCVLCPAWSGYTGSSREKCHCYQQESIKIHAYIVFLKIPA